MPAKKSIITEEQILASMNVRLDAVEQRNREQEDVLTRYKVLEGSIKLYKRILVSMIVLLVPMYANKIIRWIAMFLEFLGKN